MVSSLLNLKGEAFLWQKRQILWVYSSLNQTILHLNEWSFICRKKCILASSNPCNKNKVCPKFLSYRIISISRKNSAQPLEREVSSLQICLPLLTTFLVLKIPYREYYLYLKVSFQETKNFSQDRQCLKLIKWKIKDKTGHLAFTGKKD